TAIITASISPAVASPGFTIKLACLGETIAPPMRKPFNPHDSISLAASSPWGLRNTEPALGRLSGWLAARRASSSLIFLRKSAWVPGCRLNQTAAEQHAGVATA